MNHDDDLENRSRSIGSLTSATLPSLARKADRRNGASERGPDAGTTTMPRGTSLPTITRHGERGCATLPSSSLEAVAAGMHPDSLDRAIAASLPPSLASICRRVEEAYIDPVYGFDTRFVGYQLFGRADMAELEAGCELVERYLMPAPVATIKTELARLRASTKARLEADGDLSMTFQVLAEECAEYPADVMAWVLRSWAKREVFFPSLAELRDRLQQATKARRSLLGALSAPLSNGNSNPEGLSHRCSTESPSPKSSISSNPTASSRSGPGPAPSTNASSRR